MPTKKYSIQWIVNDASAVAAYKRGVKGMGDIEKAALKAANSIEAAFSRAGAAVDGLNARTARAAEGFSTMGAAASKAASSATQDFGRAGKAGEASAATFGTAWARETDRAAKALPALTAPMKQLSLESTRFGGAFAAAMGQGQIAAGKAFPAARLQLTRTRTETVSLGKELMLAGRQGAACFDLLNAPLVRAQTESVVLEERLGEVTKATDKTGKSMGGFLGKMLALQGAHAIFGTIMDESQKLEEYWQKLAEEAGSFRDSLRELASLKNQTGVNDNVTADVLDLSNKTGMLPAKAASMSAAYENIGSTVREKGHFQPIQGTPEQLEKDVLTETGRTARRLGVNEEAAGEAIGTAGLFHTFKSVQDAMEQFGGALKGLSEGKLKYGPGVTALNKGMAKLLDPAEAASEGAKAGRVGSFEEGGIYMGALSLGTGTAEQAQHRMVQNSRVLNPDADNKEGIKALKAAGLTDVMTDPEKLIQLSKYLKDKKVASARDWLAKNNLGTVATREGMEASLKVADVLESRLAKAKTSQKTNATGAATVAENARFMATDRTASAAAIEAKQDAVNKAEGILGPEEFEKSKKAAELRMQLKDPNYYSLGRRVMDKLNWPFSYVSSGVGGAEMRQETDPDYGAVPTLATEGQKYGVNVYKKYPELKYAVMPTNDASYEARARAFTKAAAEIKALGGDPLRMDALNAETQKKIDAIRPGAVAPGVLSPAMKMLGNMKLPPAALGPQTMNGFGPTGLRSALAASALAALPEVFPENAARRQIPTGMKLIGKHNLVPIDGMATAGWRDWRDMALAGFGRPSAGYGADGGGAVGRGDMAEVVALLRELVDLTRKEFDRSFRPAIVPDVRVAPSAVRNAPPMIGIMGPANGPRR